MLQQHTYNSKANPRVGYLFTMIGFAILFSLVSALLFAPLINKLVEDPSYRLFLLQIVSASMAFLLPPILVEYYYRRKSLSYLYRYQHLPWRGRVIVPLLLLLVTSGFAAQLLTQLMNLLPVPAFLSSLSDQSEAVTEAERLFLTESRPLGIVLSLVAIVVIAPIGEELLFRGALQGWLLARFKNAHAVVLLGALIFSLIHLQWEGILARFFLGAILGYLALYLGLGTSVAFHILNNLSTFMLYQAMGIEKMEAVTATLNWSDTLLGILAIVACVGVIRYLRGVAIHLERARNNRDIE